jgi:hypothetical protein
MIAQSVVKLASPLVEWLSFEKFLTAGRRPNGGDIILLRTFGITIWLYLLAVILTQGLDPERSWNFSMRDLLVALRDTLPWAGAIFAVVYASLYARFSSQWMYLAGLYNQIKGIEARTAGTDSQTIIAEWKAGFLEDAQELHLATKRLFVSVIKAWGEDPAVKQEFIKNTPGGEDRFNDLIGSVNEAFRLYESKIQERLRHGAAEHTAGECS